MKYIKLLAMMLLPLTFAACSDDDENMNSGNATVGFSQSEIDVKENVSSIQVPITVTGEHSGLIEVTVTVKNASGISVENDKTVLLTSEKIPGLPEGRERPPARNHPQTARPGHLPP